MNRGSKIAINAIEALLEPPNVQLYIGAHVVSRHSESVLLTNNHLNQLPSPCYKLGEPALIRVGERTDFGSHCLTEMRQNGSIDSIGLCEPFGSLSEVTDLPRVNYGDRQRSLGKR